MSKKFLNYKYIKQNDGVDEVAKSLNCLRSTTYLILKNKYKMDFYTPYFLEDLSLKLVKDEQNKICDLDINRLYNVEDLSQKLVKDEQNKIYNLDINRLYDNSFIAYKNHKSNDPIKTIKSLLKDEMLLVCPDMFYLPFSRFYDPNHKDFSTVNLHGFLLIHYDKENYYYVEGKTHLNKDKSKIKKYKGDIGIIDADTFEKALNETTNIYTVSLKDHSIDKVLKWDSMVFRTICNHYNAKYYVNNKTVLLGRKALEELIQTCQSDQQSLLDIVADVHASNKNLYTMLNWRLWEMQLSREILVCFLRESFVRPDMVEYLIHNLKASIDAVSRFNHYLSKQWYAHNYSFDSRYLEFIQKLMICDDLVYKDINNNFNEGTVGQGIYYHVKSQILKQAANK